MGRREAREGGGGRREPRGLRGGVEAGERRGRGGRGHDAGVAAARRCVACSLVGTEWGWWRAGACGLGGSRGSGAGLVRGDSR